MKTSHKALIAGALVALTAGCNHGASHVAATAGAPKATNPAPAASATPRPAVHSSPAAPTADAQIAAANNALTQALFALSAASHNLSSVSSFRTVLQPMATTLGKARAAGTAARQAAAGAPSTCGTVRGNAGAAQSLAGQVVSAAGAVRAQQAVVAARAASVDQQRAVVAARLATLVHLLQQSGQASAAAARASSVNAALAAEHANIESAVAAATSAVQHTTSVVSSAEQTSSRAAAVVSRLCA